MQKLRIGQPGQGHGDSVSNDETQFSQPNMTLSKTPLVILLAFYNLASAGTSGKAPIFGKEPALPEPTIQAPSRSRFRLSAGASYRSLGFAGFRTGSDACIARLPFGRALPQFSRANIGSTTEEGDRYYSDGYVLKDPAASDGYTWNWGYDSNSQITNGAPRIAARTVRVQKLTFHAEETIGSSDSGGICDENQTWGGDMTGAAPVVQLDWLHDLTPTVSLGLSMQWSFLSTDGSQALSNYSAFSGFSMQTNHIQDQYAFGGHGLPAPSVPYRGDESGASIRNKPAVRTLTPGARAESETIAWNEIFEEFEISLHTLSIGPTVEKRIGKASLAFSGGLALNITNWSASHQETLYASTDGGAAQTIGKWNHRKNGTEVLVGGYVQANLGWQITEKWNLSAYGRHDWSSAFKTAIGPSSFAFDPSGWSVGALVGWRF